MHLALIELQPVVAVRERDDPRFEPTARERARHRVVAPQQLAGRVVPARTTTGCEAYLRSDGGGSVAMNDTSMLPGTSRLNFARTHLRAVYAATLPGMMQRAARTRYRATSRREVEQLLEVASPCDGNYRIRSPAGPSSSQSRATSSRSPTSPPSPTICPPSSPTRPPRNHLRGAATGVSASDRRLRRPRRQRSLRPPSRRGDPPGRRRAARRTRWSPRSDGSARLHVNRR